MKKIRVLFVCVHNSARSQMAEAFVNHLAGHRFEASSGGIEPGELHPLVVTVMKEVGIDISGNRTKSVFDFYKKGDLFQYVIAVCDEASQRCPIFPGHAKMLSWSFEDPWNFEGSEEEKLEKTRAVRDQILGRVEQWVKEVTRD
jgi:arsenate reductase